MNINTSIPVHGFIPPATVPDTAGARNTVSSAYDEALSVSHNFAPVELDGVEDVPEETFKRDDKMGKLVEQAFALDPPPMPVLDPAVTGGA